MNNRPTYEELEQRVRDLEGEVARHEKERQSFELQIKELISVFDDLKLAEQALHESEERYRRITRAVTDYIYTVIIEDGRPVDTIHGPGCVKVTGYAPEEFKANPGLWLEMVHEEDREAVRHQAADIISGKDVAPLEHRICRKDRQIRWVRNSPVPFRGGQGGLVYYDGLIQDITERRLAEIAPEENEARYKGIVKHTNNGVAVYRAVDDGNDFLFVDINKACERIERVRREDLVGKSVQEIFPGIREFGLLEVLQRVWKTGKPEHSPVSFYEDERISGWRDNFVYKLPSGEVVAVYSDETQRKKTEDALHRANEELHNFSRQLEQMVRQRTDELEEKNKKLIAAERIAATCHIANRVAHELRNSLTVVGGFARRTNAKTPEGDPRKKYLRVIVDEVGVLEKKVSDIISMEEGLGGVVQ